MDNLWFHQIILSSEPISGLGKNSLETTAQPFSKSLAVLPPSLSLPTLPHAEISSAISLLPDGEISSDSSPSTPQEEYYSNEDQEKEISQLNEIPSRLSRIRCRNGSCSSSPSTRKRRKNLADSITKGRLPKSMSCKTLGELELEEVKGFMDLGFRFNKEHLSPRMLTVVPGLQRLAVYEDKQSTDLIDVAEVGKHDETEEGTEKRLIQRPYLSEAWFIKIPDSPPQNLRMPRASTAAGMKKHIRSWARTVASVIQQES